MNRVDSESKIDMRLRTMRILWGSFLMNVGLFVALVNFVNPRTDLGRAGLPGESAPTQLPTLLILFFVLSGVAVALSFVLKRLFFRKAVSEQRLDHVQTGTILALVLCEVAALFGLLSLFLNGNRYAYLLFIVGAGGMLLHFPQREHLLAASYRDGSAGSMSA